MHFFGIGFFVILNVSVEKADNGTTDDIIFFAQEPKDSFLDPYFDEVNGNFIEVNFSVVFVGPLTILEHAFSFVSKASILIVWGAFHILYDLRLF